MAAPSEHPASLDLVIPPDPVNLRHVRRALREVAPRVVAPERVEDVLLAVSEAVNNAILHATGEDGRREGGVAVHIRPREDVLRVEVVDRGRGFREGERAGTTGLGIGLWLIDHLADGSRVTSGPRGTCVTMCFRSEATLETC